ncbi:MAG TPA: TIGR02391 family protein [Alphaproteobacteria bacterium]|nr:TIGR02391 family protein [Alphaproteobacteria bacterium]
MGSDNALAIGLGVVGGILILAALNNKKTEAQLATPEARQTPPTLPKTPDQQQAERVGGLLKEGHFAEAVNVSCKVLFGLIRRKSGVSDKDTMQLIDHVFSPKKPVLKFTRHDAYPHLNTHEGYYYLLKGISSAFRNPASHENVSMTQQEAVAQIALIGHLYGLVENHTSRVLPTEAIA